MSQSKKEALFWRLADQMYADKHVKRSTMMGFACLRYNKQFFASLDHRTHDLIVKLPAEQVEKLIDDSTGIEFSPAGRKFRQWVAIPEPNARRWKSLMAQAKEFVS